MLVIAIVVGGLEKWAELQQCVLVGLSRLRQGHVGTESFCQKEMEMHEFEKIGQIGTEVEFLGYPGERDLAGNLVCTLGNTRVTSSSCQGCFSCPCISCGRFSHIYHRKVPDFSGEML